MKKNGSIQKMLDKYMDLYIKSKKNSGASWDKGESDVFIAKSLFHKRQFISQILKRSKLGDSIRLLAADQKIFSVLSQNNTLLYTHKNLVPDHNALRWISVNGSEGFAFHENLDDRIVASLKLSYESMMNDGTIRNDMNH